LKGIEAGVLHQTFSSISTDEKENHFATKTIIGSMPGIEPGTSCTRLHNEGGQNTRECSALMYDYESIPTTALTAGIMPLDHMDNNNFIAKKTYIICNKLDFLPRD
jgi:hypothetical protein